MSDIVRFRNFLLVPILLVIFSCATGPRPTTANYQKILDTWVGEQIDQLIAAWGYPKNEFIAPNGRKVYVYERSRIMSMPSYTTPSTSTVNVDTFSNTATVTTTPGMTFGGGIAKYVCVTWIETNNSGTIVNWNWRGNDCTAGELK